MKNEITLIAQSFGQINEYLRTVLSICSFYSHLPASHRETRTLLFTDAAEFFKPHFKDLPVFYVMLTAERLRQMRGEIDFLHRIKIAILDEAFGKTEGNLFYVDADTFFIKDPSHFFQNLSAKVTFMHTPEYVLRTLVDLPLPSGAPFHSVLKFINDNELTLANGEKRKFSTSLLSWNAGAIMLHRLHRFLLPDVYAITDQLYAATKNHASEQFAFSLVLQTHTEVQACESVIYHYWYKVTKQITDDFLSAKINEEWMSLTPNQKRTVILAWTKKLPEYFEKHPFTLRDNAIQCFNSNKFRRGFYWALRALSRNPFHIGFLRDFAYHTRRFLFKF